MGWTTAELRSECALLAASADILVEHCRMADEINAMHKADHARDLFLEAYGLLGHPAKRTDDDTNAVYTTDDGGKF